MPRPLKLLIVMGFCLCFSLSAQAAELVDRVVAVVNGKLITLFDVNARVTDLLQRTQGVAFKPDDPRNVELQKQVLESLINDILIEQEAARLKVTVSETELDSQIDDLKKKNNLTQQQLQTELLKEGMTLKDFREKLRKDNVKKRLLGYMVHRKAMVTDEEVREYYEQNKGSLPSQVSLLGPRVSGGIGFIMVPTKKDAEELRKKISAGGLSFADAAKRYSIGPGKEQGGSLGDVQLKDLAPPLREALAAVPEGQVTEPVLLDGRAVLLIRTKPGQPAKAAPAKPAPSATDPSFDSVKDKIQEILYQQKVEKLFQDYISNLRSKAVIDIRM
ncbi:MAG: SurA N-terminal domain-containing protein [Desulfovibrionaceae bacterium]